MKPLNFSPSAAGLVSFPPVECANYSCWTEKNAERCEQNKTIPEAHKYSMVLSSETELRGREQICNRKGWGIKSSWNTGKGMKISTCLSSCSFLFLEHTGKLRIISLRRNKKKVYSRLYGPLLDGYMFMTKLCSMKYWPQCMTILWVIWRKEKVKSTCSVTQKDASLGLADNIFFLIKCEVKGIVCIISTSNRIRTWFSLLLSGRCSYYIKHDS